MYVYICIVQKGAYQSVKVIREQRTVFYQTVRRGSLQSMLNICVYMCIYIYVCVYVCICICIYIYIYVYVCVYLLCTYHNADIVFALMLFQMTLLMKEFIWV